ncbi:MAG: phosphonate ABC transporter, permease protein PhnE [Rhodospirillaceae bacterium]
MIVQLENGARTWSLHTPAKRAAIWMGWLVGLAITVVCLQRIAAETMWEFVFDAPSQAADIFTRMVPPEWIYGRELLRPLWDTVTMATLGTLLAIIVGVPLAFFAARNTTPGAFTFRPVALFLIVASRSINSLIWGLVLVVIVGPGVLAGVLAIALRSVGFIAKLLYEALEESDHRPAEAVAATGASRLQVVSYGIWPQVLPAFAGISLFRWDINIREATVLGLVGAGGIGIQLNASINALEWSRVSVILVLIFMAVLAAETISARVRKAVT